MFHRIFHWSSISHHKIHGIFHWFSLKLHMFIHFPSSNQPAIGDPPALNQPWWIPQGLTKSPGKAMSPNLEKCRLRNAHFSDAPVITSVFWYLYLHIYIYIYVFWFWGYYNVNVPQCFYPWSGRGNWSTQNHYKLHRVGGIWSVEWSYPIWKQGDENRAWPPNYSHSISKDNDDNPWDVWLGLVRCTATWSNMWHSWIDGSHELHELISSCRDWIWQRWWI